MDRSPKFQTHEAPVRMPSDEAMAEPKLGPSLDGLDSNYESHIKPSVMVSSESDQAWRDPDVRGMA